jgi:hypothetical protein
MEQEVRCQSCGMLMGNGIFGTLANGKETQEYCSFCFQNGKYTNPEATLHGMIENSVRIMTKKMAIPEDRAREIANATIPQLKRWSTPGNMREKA